MIRFQHLLIIILGIFMSFLLFAECGKLNPERKSLDEINRRCRLYKYSKLDCGFYLAESIKREYGKSYEKLEDLKYKKMMFYNLPIIGAVLTIFVVFAAARNEILLSYLAIQPLVFFLSGSDEAFLIPLFLILIPALAFFLRGLKRFAVRRLATIV